MIFDVPASSIEHHQETTGSLGPELKSTMRLLWVRALGVRAGERGDCAVPKWAQVHSEVTRLWREGYAQGAGLEPGNPQAKPLRDALSRGRRCAG